MGQADASVSTEGLIDLASERLGGRAVAASDDFFASRANLVRASAPVFVPGKYTVRGKWMDGWESRRKRVPGHDWCVVELGAPGVVRAVDVDTSHFNGNQPEFCTVEGAEIRPREGKGPGAGRVFERAEWVEIVARTALGPSRAHLIEANGAAAGRRFTHVRLNIVPDGGVARLRVYGEVVADWEALRRSRGMVDLAAAVNGGLVVAANDMHFGSRNNMIMPGRAKNMGDGWETRRNRGLTWEDGRPRERDWAIVRLGRRGTVSRVEVDTNHFKGNFPESCMVEVCDAGAGGEIDAERAEWVTLVGRSRLRASSRHVFQKEIGREGARRAWTHARLSIFPDGGISRFRMWGRPA